jgi:hypothetical protein
VKIENVLLLESAIEVTVKKSRAFSLAAEHTDKPTVSRICGNAAAAAATFSRNQYMINGFKMKYSHFAYSISVLNGAVNNAYAVAGTGFQHNGLHVAITRRYPKYSRLSSLHDID